MTNQGKTLAIACTVLLVLACVSAAVWVYTTSSHEPVNVGGSGSAQNTYTAPTTTLVVVGVTSTQVLTINGQRSYAYVTETATATVPVWCAEGAVAQVSLGRPINPSGSSTRVDYIINANALYLGALNCVAAASTTLTVTESPK